MKKRKLLLGLGGVSAFVLPLATVSCKDEKLTVAAAKDVKLEEILPSELKVEQLTVTAPEGWTIKEGTVKIEEAKDKEGTVKIKATVTKDKEEKELTYDLSGLKKGEEKPAKPTPAELKLTVAAAKDVKLEEILPSELKVEQLTVTAPEGWKVKDGSIALADAKDKEGTVTVKATIEKDGEEAKELTYALEGLKKEA